MKILKYVVLVVLVLAMIVFINLGLKITKAPSKALEEIENMNPTPEADSLFFTLNEDSLVRAYAYAKALNRLAKRDSIHMVLNLSDETASLHIKGVPIFTSRLSYVENDELLTSFSTKRYGETFSRPIMIRSIESTIVKEPIVEREAPKDTLEAALNAYTPDTLIQFPAFVRLTLDNGIVVQLEQSKIETKEAKQTRSEFIGTYSANERKKKKRAAFTSAELTYTPLVVAKLNVNDLRAIYRAIPDKRAYIVLKY